MESSLREVRKVLGDLSSDYDEAAEAAEQFSKKASSSQKSLASEYARLMQQRKQLEQQEVENTKEAMQAKTNSINELNEKIQQVNTKRQESLNEEYQAMSQNLDRMSQEANIYRKKEIEKERQKLIEQSRLKEQQLALDKEAAATSAEEKAQIEEEYNAKMLQLSQAQQQSQRKEKAISKAEFLQDGIFGIPGKAIEQQQKKLQGAKEDALNAKASYEEAKAAAKENPKDPAIQEQLEIQRKQLNKANQQATLAQMQLKATELSNELLKTMDKSVNQVMNIASEYQPKLNARLQGTDKTFTSISKLLKSNLTLSPYVKTETVIKNIAELSEQGIAYNLEQRAFLKSIAEDIATTFDAANGTLLRLIRIQQQDTTGARLGMEASLTQLFNKMFKDTSYLGSLSQSVTDALLEAESLRSREDALELEYTVQKWLGALTSLGVGQSAVQNIATAVGQLASGNVQQLVGTPMMTLLAMSAQKGGVDFSNLLGGFSTQEINNIMYGLVTQLQESKSTSINNNSSNLVVLSALASVLGVSPSDIIGASNLSQTEINTLLESTLTYEGATNQLTYQMGQISNRLSLQTMMDNIFSNIIYSMGEDIATNPIMYGIYKGTDLMKSITGGIHLPAINVFGSGIDLTAFTIEDLIKGGVMGISAVSSLISAVQSLNNKGGLSLTSWGATETNIRGGLEQLGVTGINAGKSGSAYIATGSTEDMKKQSMMDTSQDEDVKQISEEHQAEHDFDEFYTNVMDRDRAVRVVFDSDMDLPVHIVKCDEVLQFIPTISQKLSNIESGSKRIFSLEQLQGTEYPIPVQSSSPLDIIGWDSMGINPTFNGGYYE